MQKTQRSGLSGSGVSGIRWPLFYFMSVRELLNDKAVTMMLVDNKSLNVSMGLKLDTVNQAGQPLPWQSYSHYPWLQSVVLLLYL
jgi:hypothetical protein